ncbi:MAG: HNH endonuclease [Bacillus sp. (in: Bacteria)]|nr:HNH endonuclease [Bacillus sp. (in: firmicutes)]
MKFYKNTYDFYRSDDWNNCKMQVLHERVKPDGSVICEHCGKPITKGFNPSANNNAEAIVFHHKIYLNNTNVNDASISINPDNIQIVHWRCHNEIHERFGYGGNTVPEKKVYLITGAACSGKTSWVKERIQANDVVIDIDDIWQTISGQPRYTKPNSLKPIVFKLREELKGLIQRGTGTWRNAYIIESLPGKIDREREADRYKAFNVEVITMNTTQEECLNRLHTNPDGRSIKDYEQYIKEYYERYN